MQPDDPLEGLGLGTTDDDFLLRRAQEEDRKDADVSSRLTMSQYVERYMRFPGDERFSFEGREYLRPIYDDDHREQLLKCGRQSEKSTTRGNQCLIWAVVCPGIRELYVNPSDRQTKTFSFERIRTPLLDSPELKRYASSPRQLSVYDPLLDNGSIIKLRSCFLHADRVRGERADNLFIDEMQDIIAENLPVIEQCLFHGRKDLQYSYYSGTPKTFDNPLEYTWSVESTMTELMFPCRAHGTPKLPWTWHWFHITVDCIGRKGLICPRCGAPVSHLDPDVIWVDTAPKPEERHVKGYHIPQLVTPMAHDPARAWTKIVRARTKYPAFRFYNEIMGESYDFGSRPLSAPDLAACQNPGWEMRPDQLTHMMQLSGRHPVYAGIDWGGDEHSYTIIALGTYAKSPTPEQFFMFYWHRFSGKDIGREKQLELIYNLIRGFRVRYTIADYGMGYYENNWLVRRLGAQHFARMQYIRRQQHRIVYRPHLGWFTAYKSMVCADMISAIKNRKLAFPAWSVFADPYGQDMLNIRGEFNERTNEVMFVHAKNTTVDSFHAGFYCLSASLKDHPRPDITHLAVDPAEVDPAALDEEEYRPGPMPL